MSNLTIPFDIKIRPGDVVSIAMSNVKIFRGGAVGVVRGTGYAVKFAQGTASMIFMGIAQETVDNSAGSAGDKRIRILRRGLVEFNQTGLAVTDIGAPAYLSDDNIVTTTPNAVCVGVIVALDADTGKALVDIDAAVSHQTRSAYTQTYSTADRTHANPTATALTDNTAGTANTTLQALADGTTYANDVAAIRNNFADLAASCNALIADVADVKQIVNGLIDDLQALGLIS